MANRATITVVGYLAGDPETRFTPNGQNMMTFSIPTSTKRNGEELTSWWRCTVWGKQAEGLDSLAQQGLMVKGAIVQVTGRVDAREYTDNNGNKRTSLDVNADNVTFLAPPRQQDGQGQQGRQQRPTPAFNMPPESFDEVPF